MAMRRETFPESAIEIFENEFFGRIRFIRPDPDFDPWFVAVDICKTLGIKNSRDAVSNLDDDEKMTVILIGNRSKNGVTNTVGSNDAITGAVYPKNGVTNTLNSNDGSSNAISRGWIENRVTVISEAGLYRLIMSSRKPEAKKFQRWVYHEVLPSIRKYGYYIAPYQKIIEIKGTENLEAFKAKYPEGAVEVKAIFVEADENEYGEESMAYFRYKVVVHSNNLIAGR